MPLREFKLHHPIVGASPHLECLDVCLLLLEGLASVLEDELGVPQLHMTFSTVDEQRDAVGRDVEGPGQVIPRCYPVLPRLCVLRLLRRSLCTPHLIQLLPNALIIRLGLAQCLIVLRRLAKLSLYQVDLGSLVERLRVAGRQLERPRQVGECALVLLVDELGGGPLVPVEVVFGVELHRLVEMNHRSLQVPLHKFLVPLPPLVRRRPCLEVCASPN
mmetsp:Transcript_12601/g.31696  ORF Transcript_12601/g.31696 Transcript_12601/m.31696 type:complete len:217 (-) Transcript_12601:23-673(-)